MLKNYQNIFEKKLKHIKTSTESQTKITLVWVLFVALCLENLPFNFGYEPF